MQILLPVFVFTLASERAGGQLGLMYCQVKVDCCACNELRPLTLHAGIIHVLS